MRPADMAREALNRYTDRVQNNQQQGSQQGHPSGHTQGQGQPQGQQFGNRPQQQGFPPGQMGMNLGQRQSQRMDPFSDRNNESRVGNNQQYVQDDMGILDNMPMPDTSVRQSEQGIRDALGIPTMAQRDFTRQLNQTQGYGIGSDPSSSGIQGYMNQDMYNNPQAQGQMQGQGQGQGQGSFMDNHGDAVLAGIGGLLIGRLLNSNNPIVRNVADRLGLSSQSGEGMAQGMAQPQQSSGRRPMGFFGTLITMIGCAFLIFTGFIFLGMLMNFKENNSEVNSFTKFISEVSGRKIDGTEYVPDKSVTGYTTSDLIESEETVPYERVDNDTVSIKLGENLKVTTQFKGRNKSGELLMKIKKSPVDKSIVDYEVIKEND